MNLELARPGLGRLDNSMRLHLLDVNVADAAVLVDAARLREILSGAALDGGATVVADAFHVFPNGGVTGVLVLAQSHLSIHTWPELLLANVDLLSYGSVDGATVMAKIADAIGATSSRFETVERRPT